MRMSYSQLHGEVAEVCRVRARPDLLHLCPPDEEGGKGGFAYETRYRPPTDKRG